MNSIKPNFPFCIWGGTARRSIGQLAFEDFIAKLPESKYEFLDALYIRVEALSKADLEMLRFAPW